MRKLEDHDPLTGKYIAAVQSYCNVNNKNSMFLSEYIHKLLGYDTHLLTKELVYDQERCNSKQYLF